MTDRQLAAVLDAADNIRVAVETELQRRESEPTRWRECPECGGTLIKLELHRWWKHGKASPPPPQAYQKLRSELRSMTKDLLRVLEKGRHGSGLSGLIAMMSPRATTGQLARWMERYDLADLTDKERQRLTVLGRQLSEAVAVGELTYRADDPEIDDLVRADLADTLAMIRIVSGEVAEEIDRRGVV
jgi:hypothetical protein